MPSVAKLTPSVASEVLKLMLTPRGARAALASAVDEQPYQVSHWLSGYTSPSPKRRENIEDLLGVSWRLWAVYEFTEDDVARAFTSAKRSKSRGVAKLVEAHEAAKRAKTGTEG